MIEDFGDHLVICHSINKEINIPEMSDEFPDDEFQKQICLSFTDNIN